ncbi:MAG: hypothetical protein ACON5A_00830 [Candidatus Comchoanobacterales bacterium]
MAGTSAKAPSKTQEHSFVKRYFWQTFWQSFVLSSYFTSYLFKTANQQPKLIIGDQQTINQAVKVSVFAHLAVIGFRAIFFGLCAFAPLPDPIVIFMAIETILPTMLYLLKAFHELRMLMVVYTAKNPGQQWGRVTEEGSVLAAWHLARTAPNTTQPPRAIFSLSDALVSLIISNQHSATKEANMGRQTNHLSADKLKNQPSGAAFGKPDGSLNAQKPINDTNADINQPINVH